jgi:hypothetical protein
MKMTLSTLLLLTIGLLPITSDAQTKRIGMKRATQIATKRIHGRVKSSELEKEKGRWIYSFDISTGKGKITEVNVDAYSGKIIGIEHESAKKEADENKMEMKGKH